MTELLGTDGEEFFTSYDEVYDSFDAMGLQENLLRGIYAYGFEKPSAKKRRCRGVEDRVEKNLKSLSSSCKQTLLRLVHSELSFLSRYSSTRNPNPNLPLSVNIGHLEAVTHILQQPFITGVSRVCKPIPRSPLVPNGHKDASNLKGIHVDIVCTLNGDPVWFIVSDRNPKYICWHGNGSCRNKGLKMRLEHVLYAASSSITLKPSSIILFFSNGLENNVIENLREEFGATEFKMDFSRFDCGFCEELEGEWINILARSYQKASVLEIKVACPGSAISSRSNFGVKEPLLGAARPDLSGEDIVGNFDSFCSFISQIKLSLLDVEDARFALAEGFSSNSDLINFDTTALIAIVSGISNGYTEKLMAIPQNELRRRFKSNFEFVIAQVMSEVQNPIHLELGGVISGKGGIICETVCSEFKELVSMCGGPNEKLRAKNLLKHLLVVPDSPSARMMSLPTTRKLALKNKLVFGTGDYWRAPTLTANMAFVRAVSQTGMSLFTIEHRPRALTGE